MTQVVDRFEERGPGIYTRVLVPVFWMAILVTGFSVIYVTYESRQFTQQLEELRREAINLKVSSGQYRLEKSSLASYPRVESIASEKLNMFLPKSGETVLVVKE